MAQLEAHIAQREAAKEGVETPVVVPVPEDKPAEKNSPRDSPANTLRKQHGKEVRAKKKTEKEERDSITDLDVMLAMRPRYIYHPASKRYDACGILIGGLVFDWPRLAWDLPYEDDKLILHAGANRSVTDEDIEQVRDELMPTLGSAMLELKKKNLAFEEVDLWVEEDAHRKQRVVNLYPASRDAVLPLPERVGTVHWKSLLYNDGFSDIVYPIPPPINENLHPPIVADHKWISLVEYTRSQATDVPRLHAIKLISEQVPIRLASIDASGSFSSGNINLSNVDPLHRTDREMLAHALKGMGLLEYEGQNGMCYIEAPSKPGEVGESLRSNTDTYADDPKLLGDMEPRVLWRDLPPILKRNPELKDDLRDQIRHIVWVAFEAG